MKIRKIDKNHDWQFGKGRSSYAMDEAAIEQNIKTRILSWQNDCFFALDEGIDWRNLLEKGRAGELQAAVKSVILASEGVIAINDIQAKLNPDRSFTIQYDIETIYSQSFKATVEG